MQKIYFIIFILFMGHANKGYSFPVSTQIQEAQYLKDYPQNNFTYQVGLQKIRAIIAGDDHNPPLLLIHGSPGSWGTWVRLLLDPKLLEHYQIIALDRPGYGKSGKIAELSNELEAAEMMAALQFNHSGQKAMVVGYSYGGAIAATMAINYSDDISSMLLVSGTLCAQFEKVKWYNFPAQWGLIRHLLPHDFVVSSYESAHLPSQLSELYPKWPTLQMPVAIIQGLADKIVNPKTADFAEKVLINASPLLIQRIPGMDHLIPFYHHDIILKKIWDLEKLTKVNPGQLTIIN